MSPPAAPSVLAVSANGMTHNVLEWSPEAAWATVLLLHGYMDAARTWDQVAPSLMAAGYRVLAPDFRGFGDGPRAPSGGYYYFPDYIHDVADLVETLVPGGAELSVVGHSMGGTVATLYAGTFPERVARLALLEGAGPPDHKHDHAPEQMRRWIESVRSIRVRGERTLPSREVALDRLVANHPRVHPDILVTRLDALAHTLPDGRLAWKADLLHATRSPIPFFAQTWKGFAARVTCPVLSVSGGAAGWHPPDEEERLSSFQNLERAEIPDAGHMMHWSKPEELSAHLLRFLGVPH
jgi:pimeloyl-ACP methyl ester carboxylesterase